MSTTLPGSTISAILRHDSKVTSYTIALLRAINDVVLAYPELHHATWSCWRTNSTSVYWQ